MSTKIFDATGRQLWAGDGVLKLAAVARQFGGVQKITVERRRIRSIQDDEARVKVAYQNGCHGYASFFSFDRAQKWACTRTGDARSAFFCCQVEYRG